MGIIEGAIGQTEDRTRTADDAMIARLRMAGRDGSSPPRYAQLLSAAQALLTGQAHRALDRRAEVAPYASWGSWIEGLPFAHALMLNEGMIVDLIPCRDEAAFLRNYRCSPEQFLELTNRVIETRGEIRFNIRDYDPARPESLDAYRDQPESLRSIYLYALEDGAARFYLNSVRRESLLRLLGAVRPMQDWRDALGGAGAAAKEDRL